MSNNSRCCGDGEQLLPPSHFQLVTPAGLTAPAPTTAAKFSNVTNGAVVGPPGSARSTRSDVDDTTQQSSTMDKELGLEEEEYEEDDYDEEENRGNAVVGYTAAREERRVDQDQEARRLEPDEVRVISNGHARTSHSIGFSSSVDKQTAQEEQATCSNTISADRDKPTCMPNTSSPTPTPASMARAASFNTFNPQGTDLLLDPDSILNQMLGKKPSDRKKSLTFYNSPSGEGGGGGGTLTMDSSSHAIMRGSIGIAQRQQQLARKPIRAKPVCTAAGNNYYGDTGTKLRGPGSGTGFRPEWSVAGTREDATDHNTSYPVRNWAPVRTPHSVANVSTLNPTPRYRSNSSDHSDSRGRPTGNAGCSNNTSCVNYPSDQQGRTQDSESLPLLMTEESPHARCGAKSVARIGNTARPHSGRIVLALSDDDDEEMEWDGGGGGGGGEGRGRRRRRWGGEGGGGGGGGWGGRGRRGEGGRVVSDSGSHGALPGHSAHKQLGVQEWDTRNDTAIARALQEEEEHLEVLRMAKETPTEAHSHHHQQHQSDPHYNNLPALSTAARGRGDVRFASRVNNNNNTKATSAASSTLCSTAGDREIAMTLQSVLDAEVARDLQEREEGGGGGGVFGEEELMARGGGGGGRGGGRGRDLVEIEWHEMRPYHVFMGGRPYNNHHNRHRHPHPHHFNSIATAHPRAHFQGEWEGEEGRGMSGSHGYPRPHTRSAGGRRGNHRPSHFGASPHLNHGDIDMSYESLLELEDVSTGLDADSISRLTSTFRYTQGSESREKSCSVCLQAFEIGQTLRSLPCLHMFHMDCIDKWLSSNRSCPVCFKDIKEL